jgi:hypothetical protein
MGGTEQETLIEEKYPHHKGARYEFRVQPETIELFKCTVPKSFSIALRIRPTQSLEIAIEQESRLASRGVFNGRFADIACGGRCGGACPFLRRTALDFNSDWPASPARLRAARLPGPRLHLDSGLLGLRSR